MYSLNSKEEAILEALEVNWGNLLEVDMHLWITLPRLIPPQNHVSSVGSSRKDPPRAAWSKGVSKKHPVLEAGHI